jgi:hypothetical protein
VHKETELYEDKYLFYNCQFLFLNFISSFLKAYHNTDDSVGESLAPSFARGIFFGGDNITFLKLRC